MSLGIIADLPVMEGDNDSLGMCALAADVPFSGMAYDIFQRRVQGVSWKEIADEFDLGSPGKARKTFTKLTGITDYQIKGPQLLKLAQGGLDPKLTAAKVKIPKGGKPGTSVPTKGQWDETILNHPSANDVIDLNSGGTGYLKISQQTGLPIADVDEIVWNSLLKDSGGDIWTAYINKPGSQTGFNAVKQLVFDLRKAGLNVNDVVKSTGIDEKVVQAIIKGNWQLPSPGVNTYYVPKPPSVAQPYGGSAYNYTQNVADINEMEFPVRTHSDMVDNFAPDINASQKAALRKYTGSSYHDINGALRGNYPMTSTTRTTVDQMDRGMMRTTQPVTVIRGTDRRGFGMGQISDSDIENLPGLVVRDRGYMSTSIRREGVFGNEIQLVLECPPGTTGYYVGRFSMHQHELEFLVGRDQPIMINRVEKVGSRYRVYARVIV